MSLICTFIRKSVLLSGSPAAASALDQSFLQALPGFIVVLTRDGKLLYVSENVQEYLGLSMVRHLCSFLFHTHLYFLRFTGETGYYNEYFWLSVIHSLDTQVCLGKTGGVCVGVKLTVLFPCYLVQTRQTLQYQTHESLRLYVNIKDSSELI